MLLGTVLDGSFDALVGDVKTDVIIPIHTGLPFKVGNRQEVFLGFLTLRSELFHPNSDGVKRVDALRRVHNQWGIPDKRDM